LLSLKLSPSMRPEEAAGIFDRVAAARAGAAVAREAENALTLALGSITGCLHEAGAIPFFAAFAVPGQGALLQACQSHTPSSVLHDDAALQQALAALERAPEAYRRCEQLEQERRGLYAILKERTHNRMRAEQRLAEAEKRLEADGRAVCEARKNWEDQLAGFGFASSLSPQNALEALEAMSAFMTREKTLRSRQELRDNIGNGLKIFLGEIALLAHGAGFALPAGILPAPCSPVFSGPVPSTRSLPATGEQHLAPGPDSPGQNSAGNPAVIFQQPAPSLVPAVLQLLETLSSRVEEAVLAQNRLWEKKELLAGRLQDIVRAGTSLELTQQALAALLAGAGMPDAEHFRAAFARFRRIEDLQARERSLLAGIRSLAQEEGENMEDLLDSLEQSKLDRLREDESRLQEELAAMERQAHELSVERGQFLERRDALSASEGRTALLRREAVLQEELHSLSRRWSVLALARDFLLAAKSHFEEEGQQGVIRFAGDLFSSITDGEYTGITAGLEGDDFTALHRSGDRFDPEKQLSQGTREQLYLALRLAYIKNHATRAESLPLIMDDILVNFDPGRAANTAKVLTTFAKDSQLLFFTCHPGTVELFLQAARRQETGSLPPVFSISKGEITPLSPA
jgi:uncharacterized protein YhaN